MARSHLALLATLVLSWPASARPALAPVLAKRPLLSCPTPTVAQCTDPLWQQTLCGKLEMARARTLEGATCNRLLQARAARLAAFSSEQLVVAPIIADVAGTSGLASPLDGAECDASPGRVCALRADYRQRDHFAVGLTGMNGRALQRAALMPASNLSGEAAAFRFVEAQLRAGWEGNGDAVRSCREMVFEKYYDYALFEDEITRFAREPRAVVDVAYGGPDLRRSIGTRGAAGEPLRQRDGTPFSTGIAFPTNQKKNIFFETPPDSPEQDPQGALFADLVVDVPCLGRESVSLGAIRLLDPTLRALLDVDPRHDESFAWHREMSEAQQARGVLDEELEVYAEVRTRFAALLAERERIVQAFLAHIHALQNKGREQRFLTPDAILDFEDPFVNPDPTASFDELDAVTFAGLVGFLLGAEAVDAALPTANTLSAIVVEPLPALPDVTPVDATPAALIAATDAFAEQLCVDVALESAVSFAQTVMILLADVDNRIEDTLQEARALGCLDVDDPEHPCDWSPSLFSQRVVDLYAGDRERDFERCLDYTGNNFTRLQGREFIIPDPFEVVCTRDDFTTSPTQVERYYSCHDEWVRRVLAVAAEQLGHPVLDPRTGVLDVGMRRSGAGAYGNSLYGIDFDWETRWFIDGWVQAAQHGQDITRLQPQAAGHVTATGTMFGVDQRFIDAQLKVTRDVVDVDLILNVGGEDIVVYGEDPERLLHPGSVGAVADSQQRTVNFIRADHRVNVLGIPVRVRGAVDGTVGVDYTALSALRTAPDAQDLILTLTPFVRADARASASVDYGVIEAGVKGSIVLIDLRNPIGAGLHVFPGPQDQLLKVQSAASLSSTTLAGRVAIFGEIDLGLVEKSAEVTIARWGGVTEQRGLYDVHFTIPTEPLYIVAVSPLPPESP
jgi:hypothetical protein